MTENELLLQKIKIIKEISWYLELLEARYTICFAYVICLLCEILHFMLIPVVAHTFTRSLLFLQAQACQRVWNWNLLLKQIHFYEKDPATVGITNWRPFGSVRWGKSRKLMPTLNWQRGWTILCQSNNLSWCHFLPLWNRAEHFWLALLNNGEAKLRKIFVKQFSNTSFYLDVNWEM